MKPNRHITLTLELVRKELRMEWRQKYAFHGILLYVFSTVFTAYLVFEKIKPVHWVSLFWIIILFASVNALAKSFMQESRARMLYYYTIASPRQIIVAKMIYNFFLLVLLSGITYLAFVLLLDNPVSNLVFWFVVLLTGSAGFSFAFTLISAIASKARNNATLMAILSFPVILPQLGLLIEVSKKALNGQGLGAGSQELLALGAIAAIVLVVSFLLFPYLWRE